MGTFATSCREEVRFCFSFFFFAPFPSFSSFSLDLSLDGLREIGRNSSATQVRPRLQQSERNHGFKNMRNHGFKSMRNRLRPFVRRRRGRRVPAAARRWSKRLL